MRLGRRKESPTASALDLLEAAYGDRLRALERIRAAADSVHASRARLQASRSAWTAAVERHEQAARDALAAGNDTEARAAAARCVPIDADIAAASERLDRFAETEANLAAAREIVTQQLESLRRRRESLRGAHSGAAAMAAVRAELDRLAAEYQPVARAIED